MFNAQHVPPIIPAKAWASSLLNSRDYGINKHQTCINNDASTAST